ncbi:MAG: hypothetical protein K0U98_07900 [Deltaproteobacteria bacterium]|nr:hypothetical protein [Deltaproteobacteria bacterium]
MSSLRPEVVFVEALELALPCALDCGPLAQVLPFIELPGTNHRARFGMALEVLPGGAGGLLPSPAFLGIESLEESLVVVFLIDPAARLTFDGTVGHSD